MIEHIVIFRRWCVAASAALMLVSPVCRSWHPRRRRRSPSSRARGASRCRSPSINNQDYVAVDDINAAFATTSREDRLAGGLTITARGRSIVLTENQNVVSVAGRLVTLPAPPLRRDGRWFVPADFLPRALVAGARHPARSAALGAPADRRRPARPARRRARRCRRDQRGGDLRHHAEHRDARQRAAGPADRAVRRRRARSQHSAGAAAGASCTASRRATRRRRSR